MNLIVKVVKNRAGNMLFLLVRGPTLAEWALKVEPPRPQALCTNNCNLLIIV
jgi:hypothetical protein